MIISFNGKELLKELEGFRANAYKDVAGVWTIGYGTTKINGRPVEAGQTISKEEAGAALEADLAWAQTAVNQLVKYQLTQNMFDALVCFVYNIGADAFRKSTLLRLLNEGKYQEAAKQFSRWVNAGGKMSPGLVSRRHQEQQLFEKDIPNG